MSHKITMKIPRMAVGSRDVIFVVTRNSVKIGELLISKGNVEWWPKGSKTKGKYMSWKSVADHIEIYGKDIKR